MSKIIKLVIATFIAIISTQLVLASYVTVYNKIGGNVLFTNKISINSPISPSNQFEVHSSNTIGIGTITSNGVTVTGVGTNFLSELKPGTTLIVKGQSRKVQSISNGTTLILSSAFTPDVIQGAIFQYNNTLFVIKNDGRIGIGNANPLITLDVSGPIKTGFFNSSPCSGIAEGSIFYDPIDHTYCYCNGTGGVKLYDPALACF